MNPDQANTENKHPDGPTTRSSRTSLRAALRLASNMGELLHYEWLLARQEMQVGVRGLRSSIVLVLTAALLTCSSVPLLMVGMALAVADYLSLPAWSGFLVIGGLGSVAGALLLLISKITSSKHSIVPTRSLQAFRQTARLLLESVR